MASFAFKFKARDATGRYMAMCPKRSSDAVNRERRDGAVNKLVLVSWILVPSSSGAGSTVSPWDRRVPWHFP
jgi:hypothetical protein